MLTFRILLLLLTLLDLAIAETDKILRDALVLRVPSHIVSEEKQVGQIVSDINKFANDSLHLGEGYTLIKLDSSINTDKVIDLDLVGNSKLIDVVRTLARRLRMVADYQNGNIYIRFETPEERLLTRVRTQALDKHSFYDQIVNIATKTFFFEGTTERFMVVVNKIVSDAGLPVEIRLLDEKSATTMIYFNLVEAELGSILDGAASQLNPKHKEKPDILFEVLSKE